LLDGLEHQYRIVPERLEPVKQHLRPECFAKSIYGTLNIAAGQRAMERFACATDRIAVDELLNGEIFYTLKEAKIVIESWRRHYNAVRPHASPGYRAPAPKVFVPALAAWPAAQSRPAPPATLALEPRPTMN
jgi:hypothetical protein